MAALCSRADHYIFIPWFILSFFLLSFISSPRLISELYGQWFHVADKNYNSFGWLRGPAVEHRSLAGVLSLSCGRPVADG